MPDVKEGEDVDDYMDLPDEGMTERRRMAGMARHLLLDLEEGNVSAALAKAREIDAYLERLAE